MGWTTPAPGIGVNRATALAATITDASASEAGGDPAVWNGLAPRQLSTGSTQRIGKDAAGPSPTTIGRLKDGWQEEPRWGSFATVQPESADDHLLWIIPLVRDIS